MDLSSTVLLLCKYNSKTTIIRLNNLLHYEKMIDSLCQKWANLNRDSVNMFYSLPGHEHCMLDGDDDLENLFLIALQLKINNLEVVVSTDNGVSDSNGEFVSCEDNQSKIIENSELNDVEVDRLPRYCPHKKKPLLSDPWAFGIKNVGQCFEGGAEEFRIVLSKYAIKLGFDFEYVKNENSRVTVECAMSKERQCMWRIHCSGEFGNKLIQIKTMNNVHTCGTYILTHKNKRVTADIVCECIIDQVRVSPGISPIAIRKYMRSDYGVEVTYRVAWSAIKKAQCQLFGDESKSFNDLRWYIDEATRKNQGSFFKLELDEDETRFKRIFFTFYACIYGFNNCRPLLFIDGTFLKGKYKRHLLSATAKDGNNGLFPIAFAVVDAENEDNWAWFIENLRRIISDDRVYTVVSDRHGGLIEAIPKSWPDCHHAFCLVHLKNNLRDKLSKIKGESKEAIVDKFGDCAYAPTVQSYNQHMESLKSYKCKDKIRPFLDKLQNPKHWCNAFFEGNRYGEMTSNAAESFNAFVGEARDKPVMKLVDSIRAKIMEKIAESRKLAVKWNSIVCPVIVVKLQRALEEGRTWEVKIADSNVYEVCSVPSVMVDIEKRTYSCYQWQLKGIPCSHAAVAIQKSRINLDEVIDPFFHVSTYREVYSEVIYPVPSVGQLYWTCNEDFIRPPNCKTQPGRPKKRRFRSRGEKTRPIKCGRCERWGNHNRATCKAPLFDQ